MNNEFLVCRQDLTKLKLKYKPFKEKKLCEVKKTVDNTKDSLEFTQGEYDDLVERVENCENEQ